MKFKPKLDKGEEECPFEENSMEWLFWGLERILSANDDDWKNRCITEFRSCLSEGPVWPEVCNDESNPLEERATLFWIAADYRMHAPMSAEQINWQQYFA